MGVTPFRLSDQDGGQSTAIQPGDTLVVWKLDRLARSLRHLLDLHDDLQARGMALESLTENLETGSPFGEFAFHILAAVAHLERRIIAERTKAGLHAARKRGTRLGRPPKLRNRDILAPYNRIMTEKAEFDALADELDIAPITLERAFRRIAVETR